MDIPLSCSQQQALVGDWPALDSDAEALPPEPALLMAVLAQGCLFLLPHRQLRSGEGRSRAWAGASPRGTLSSIPCPIHGLF